MFHVNCANSFLASKLQCPKFVTTTSVLLLISSFPISLIRLRSNVLSHVPHHYAGRHHQRRVHALCFNTHMSSPQCFAAKLNFLSVIFTDGGLSLLNELAALCIFPLIEREDVLGRIFPRIYSRLVIMH